MRWKLCLLLAALMFYPSKIKCQNSNDDDDEVTLPNEVSVNVSMMPSRRQSTPLNLPDKVQLECYSCTFNDKQDACLDPVKYRMKATKCPSVDDRCYTMMKMKERLGGPPLTKTSMNAILNRDDVADIVRGCLKNCTSSESVTCCDLNRCNYNPFSVKTQRSLSAAKDEASCPSWTFYFTIAILMTLCNI